MNKTPTPDFNAQSKALLDPMLDLFGGNDGGVAFSKLRFDFLPNMLEESQNGNAMAAEFILMVSRMSVLCKTLTEQK